MRAAWIGASACALLLLLLGGCAGGRPGDLGQNTRTQIPPGPGLLSGKDGKFTVYSR